MSVNPSRGVLYMVWGENHLRMFRRSMDSLQRRHPELPIHVERLPDGLDPTQGLLEKARMAELSPFDTTLFLDADTVVLGRLDFGFHQAERYALACTVCECAWARRYGGLEGDLIEYNTGVIFFTRQAKPVFDAWQRFAGTLDSSIRFVHEGQLRVMPYNDQAGFAAAVDQVGLLPAVLPMNWNLRPAWQRSFFGPVKIWHDAMDVPEGLVRLAQYYEQPSAIIQYHEMRVQRQGESAPV